MGDQYNKVDVGSNKYDAYADRQDILLKRNLQLLWQLNYTISYQFWSVRTTIIVEAA